MIWKNVLLPTACLLASTYIYSHKPDVSIYGNKMLFSNPHVTGVATNATDPPIESILYNPAILKKQLSQSLVQAIGYRSPAQTHFIIHFRKEALDGEWQSFYTNGQPCDSGSFARNLPTGEWKTWYPNGKLKTIRTYNAEKYHYVKGDLQRNHPKHQRYALTRKGSAGAAPYFKPQYEGNTAAGRSLTMLQKIQHNTSDDTNLYLPPFANCLHHGTFVNYFETGAVKDSGEYVNGLPHGLWKESLNNGTMQALGFYQHGKRHGQWKYYDTNMRLVYTEQYKANGKRINQHYFK